MTTLARSVLVLALGLVGCSASPPASDAGADAAARPVDASGDSGASCTQDASEGATCGNGVCDPTETCLTCVPDCGCCGTASP